MVEAKRPSAKRPDGRMQVQSSEAVGIGEMDAQKHQIEGDHDSVLVVDDEPQVAWVLRFSLEHEGYKTYTVGTISDAEGVTVEAEAVFILPKWARARFEENPDEVRPIRFE